MRTLIVEDSERLRRSMMISMRGQGYAVETAQNGEAGSDEFFMMQSVLPKE